MRCSRLRMKARCHYNRARSGEGEGCTGRQAGRQEGYTRQPGGLGKAGRGCKRAAHVSTLPLLGSVVVPVVAWSSSMRACSCAWREPRGAAAASWGGRRGGGQGAERARPSPMLLFCSMRTHLQRLDRLLLHLLGRAVLPGERAARGGRVSTRLAHTPPRRRTHTRARTGLSRSALTTASESLASFSDHPGTCLTWGTVLPGRAKGRERVGGRCVRSE